jgi:hypothetical protein
MLWQKSHLETQISKREQQLQGASKARNGLESANEPIKAEPAMKQTMAIGCVLAMMSVGVQGRQSAPPSSAVQNPPAVQVQRTQSAKKKKTPLKQARKPAAAVPQVPPQTMPPVPATLMNSAPVRPIVTMESGLLTIDAPNSTLSDVLNGVHKVTGASIEGAAPSERVSVKLGPGDPEQVIAALLRGTPYDYVILGALGKRDAVTRVLLSQQTSQPSSGGGSVSQAPSNAEQQPPEIDESMPERTSPDDAAAQPENESDQAQPTQQPQPVPQQAQPQQQEQNQPKTPEQLFKELQQLEQQKQPK